MRQDERHHTLDDIFVGIDLATRQHQVVVLDGQGHRLTSFKVPHSREGLRELVERCSARRVGRGRGTVHFACEATGHVWEAVGAFFEQRALRYHVVNPLATFRVREARQMGRDKRDLTDAELAGVALRRRVASSLPGCTRSRARGVLVFGGFGLPHRCVCHDRGPGRIGGPCVSRGAQAGGARPLPPPATRRCRGAVRLYAVPRRTRRRGDAVRGAAGPAVWGRWRAGTTCACCARYSTSWSPASSSSCS